jgi:hypothetical protein
MCENLRKGSGQPSFERKKFEITLTGLKNALNSMFPKLNDEKMSVL